LKIGVLSDTHGVRFIAKKAVNKMEDIEILLHAGDLVEDARHLEGNNYRVYCVAGNCDAFSLEPTEKILELQGKKILLTHGHTYRVKRGYEQLLFRAKEVSADIVVFGHTHVPENTYIDNILFFNPGSTALPKNGGPGTYGIIEIADGRIKACINSI
jgi:putative phosphoesterase